MSLSAHEHIVSFHIPKTAGTTLGEFFRETFGNEHTYFFYRTLSNLSRQDREEKKLVQKNTFTHTITTIISQGQSGREILQIFRKVLAPKKPQKDRRFSLPDNGRIVHGHFHPWQILDSHDMAFVTTVRNPRERMESHYRYLIGNAIKGKSHDRLDPCTPFEQFALSPKMHNYQTNYIRGLRFEDFAAVGLSECLELYTVNFSLNPVQLRYRNTSDLRIPTQVSDRFLKQFREANENDYVFYEKAKRTVLSSG